MSILNKSNQTNSKISKITILKIFKETCYMSTAVTNYYKTSNQLLKAAIKHVMLFGALMLKFGNLITALVT